MTLTNEAHIENLYYRADALLSEGEYAEAKEVLIGILEEDPLYVMAHNHMGWLYMYKLRNFNQAEKHLKIAMKYSEGYPAPYMNYASFLLEAGRYDELLEHTISSFEIDGVDKAHLLALRGIAYEVRSEYKKALRIYELAKRYTFNEEYIGSLNTDKSRVHLKMGKFARALAVFL